MSERATPRNAVDGMTETEDMLVGMVTALAAQLSATRERLDTLERLLAAKGLPGSAEIEAFEPDDSATAMRDAMRQRMIARIFHPLDQNIPQSAEKQEDADNAKSHPPDAGPGQSRRARGTAFRAGLQDASRGSGDKICAES
jgi:hypothetical protein